MIQSKNIITLAVLATILSLSVTCTANVYAQVPSQPQPQTIAPQSQAPAQAPQVPLPPQAQADHAKNIAILDELLNKIGNDKSQAHIAAVIAQIHAEHPGLLHCPNENAIAHANPNPNPNPNSAINPSQCFVTSAPAVTATAGQATTTPPAGQSTTTIISPPIG